METGEERKVMEEGTKFKWEEEIHHVGPLRPDISQLRELKHWLQLAWWQNLF